MNVLRYSAEWHSSIPVQTVLRNSNVSPTARLLWCVLQSYASPDSPRPFPSHDLLMKCLWLKRTRLHYYQKELLDKGFLEIEKQQRKGGQWSSNVYVLKVPLDRVHSAEHGRRVHPTEYGGRDSVGRNPWSEHISTSSTESTSSTGRKSKKETTSSKAAAPQAGNVSLLLSRTFQTALQEGLKNEQLQVAQRLVYAWQERFCAWHGYPYLIKSGDIRAILSFCSSNPTEKVLARILYRAMVGWVDKEDAPNVSRGYDRYLYRKKSNDLGFVLRNAGSLENEVEEAEFTCRGRGDLLSVISGGREAYLSSNGS